MSSSAFTLALFLTLFLSIQTKSWAQNQNTLSPPGETTPDLEAFREQNLNRSDCEWAWEQLQVQEAHKTLKMRSDELPGQGIKIAHIDTGIIPFPALTRTTDNSPKPVATRKPDVFSLLTGTFNFVQPHLPAIDNHPKAVNFGHGTETASLLIGSLDKNNVANWSFEGLVPWSQLIPIKVTDSVVMLGNMSTAGTADLRNLAQGIRLASKLGVDVMTISLGALFDPDDLVSNAIQDALARGIIIIAAAGQTVPVNLIPLPARLPGVISVTASTQSKSPWQFAFSGKNISWAAPGEHVCHLSIDRSSRTTPHPALSDQSVEFSARDGSSLNLRAAIRSSSGTSYSTAFTAGAAALWLQQHSKGELLRLYGQKNISRLFLGVGQTSAMDLPTGWDTGKHGAGILNIDKLLRASLPCTKADTFDSCSVKLADFLRSTSR